MLNDFFFCSRFNDAQELLFSDKRTLFKAFAWDDDIGETNKTSRHHPKWPERNK